jgi:phosphatidylglycerol:prolipoprotein diacylglycerol transferase
MLSVYGIILAIAGWLGYQWWRDRAHKRGIEIRHVDNLTIIGIPVLIVAARLYHVLTDWQFYEHQPTHILRIWEGGLGFWGAIAGGAVTILIYTRYHRLSVHSMLNTLSLPVLGMIALGRWGNIVNAELLPYAFYDSLASVILLVILMYGERKNEFVRKNLWLVSLGIYSLTRFILEEFRIEPLIINNLTLNQLVCAVVFLGCCIGLYRRSAYKQ